MSDTTSERRLAENEAVFRKLNEQVNVGFQETNRLAQEDNQLEFLVTVKNDDEPLHFYCECADEHCTDRIILTMAEYQKIHKNRNRFIIVPGHEVRSVEKVIEKKPAYTVVKKNQDPPENPKSLHPTSIHNH
jgi:hypothetical protein